jgi:hypothetical protein
MPRFNRAVVFSTHVTQKMQKVTRNNASGPLKNLIVLFPLYYKSLITNISCYYMVSLLSVLSHFVCSKMNIKFFSTILVRYKYAQISIMEQFHLSPLPFYKFSA